MSEDYTLTKDGSFQATSAYRMKRVRAHYPDLFPLTTGRVLKQEAQATITETLGGEVLNRNFAVFCTEDLLKPVMLYALLSLGKFVSYQMMSGYRLLDICLGKDEEYASIANIHADLTILYMGFSEFDNRRQSDVLEQYVEQQAVRSRLTWLYYRGTKQGLRTKYPRFYQTLEDRNFKLFELDAVASASTSTSDAEEEF